MDNTKNWKQQTGKIMGKEFWKKKRGYKNERGKGQV